ncbi:hypothetical protein B0H66DRAFT_577388 [Apodospora peruviana]|uniref:Aminoglycoside phosphotransferase domain-containing protein n=1 Tax=Apodospora peruviana TaxID=516989 RepID=A0AAE0LZC2_9PEZI|nr:hypothetical protein B0H66DRAFT_577388 [Apodospora peruviana]
MNQSPQNEQKQEEQDGLHNAHRLANTMTLKRFTSAIERDPAADLAPLLQQQAATYPRLRNSLGQAARRRANPSKETVDGESDAETHPAYRGDLGLVDVLNQAINEGKVLWSLHGTSVRTIGSEAVVKIGTGLDPDGITNLQYINTHAPQVPAPSCLGSLLSGKRTYVFMSRAEGVTLESVWPQLSAAHKSSVQQQLNSIFRLLRDDHDDKTIPDHDSQQQQQCDQGWIGSFVSRACKDMRRSLRIRDAAGPAWSEAEFNDFLCYDAAPRRTVTPWIRMVRSFMKENHRLVRTHGDLHPRNIMVKWEEEEENGNDRQQHVLRVTSLIDWELGGWYPEYWEFVRAMSMVDVRGNLADWCEYLPMEAIGSWPEEFAVDSLIGRWLG